MHCNHAWTSPAPTHPDYTFATLVCECGATYSIGDRPQVAVT